MSQIEIVFLSQDSRSDWDPEGLLSRVSSVEVGFTRHLGLKGQPRDFMPSVLEGKHMAWVEGQLSEALCQWVEFSSVSSHLLGYWDCLEQRQGLWWGFSLFPEIFRQLLLEILSDGASKGPVLFLGISPRVWPMGEVLIQLGLDQMSFLNTPTLDQVSIKSKFHRFWGCQVDFIELKDLVQGLKKYSLCFLMDPQALGLDFGQGSELSFLAHGSVLFDTVGLSSLLKTQSCELGFLLVEESQFHPIREKLYLKQIYKYVGSFLGQD